MPKVCHLNECAVLVHLPLKETYRWVILTLTSYLVASSPYSESILSSGST